MVQFGSNPSTGTLYRASQFLSEELPIRLAHRVQELGDLPDGLNEMPSIQRVRDWYAQSFEVGQTRALQRQPCDSRIGVGDHHPIEAQPNDRAERASHEAGEE